ncbi:hypothetical protein LWF01_01255 [Saxibacter everestensis]|uniref:Uncharacterized protein n=1 Tax=Saxibacter everestensis TaxID=2909229 RepID=A0ABY8QUE1_9MICO|nr:hypothetical protein LWF01_01255 [Brevibacteriaceae bacterium ZFBP1038]
MAKTLIEELPEIVAWSRTLFLEIGTPGSPIDATSAMRASAAHSSGKS